jgi:hypothetical protein
VLVVAVALERRLRGRVVLGQPVGHAAVAASPRCSSAATAAAADALLAGATAAAAAPSVLGRVQAVELALALALWPCECRAGGWIGIGRGGELEGGA